MTLLTIFSKFNHFDSKREIEDKKREAYASLLNLKVCTFRSVLEVPCQRKACVPRPDIRSRHC